METKHTFTDLQEAYAFYAKSGGTLQTDIPCKQWTVTVYAPDYVDTCIEHGPGGMQRLSFQIRVF